MKLYHGTTAAVAKLALTQGLRPRSDTRVKGNWDHSVPSEPDLVYLTRAYAAYFAYSAVPVEDSGQAQMSHKWGIVEVETDLLDQANMRPDEDFMEQATRDHPAPLGCEDLADCETMETRTEWYRKHLADFAHHWKDSIEGLGNCAHHGAIPPEAVTRVSIYDPKSNELITMAALDPMISVLNYRFMGEKYRYLTDWLMGEEITVEQWLGEFASFHQQFPSDAWDKQRRALKKALRQRSGVELIDGPGKDSAP